MDFKDLYQKSINKPEEFWKEISDDIFWFKKPTKILNKNKILIIDSNILNSSCTIFSNYREACLNKKIFIGKSVDKKLIINILLC